MPLPIHWRTGGNVRFADVSSRLETATLEERHELLTFIRLHSARIRPRVADRWLVAEMMKYFFQCIARDSSDGAGGDDDDIDSPFDAAGQMVRWFNWYRKNEKQVQRIQNIADMIAGFYRDQNDVGRNCLETGFLEHVLEVPENRSFFRGWEDDPVLAEAYRASLKWGLAHETTEEP
jgi:hypothetical protein